MSRKRDAIQRYTQALREYIREHKSNTIDFAVTRTERLGGFVATTKISYDEIGKVVARRYFGNDRLLKFEKDIGLKELACLRVDSVAGEIKEVLDYGTSTGLEVVTSQQAELEALHTALYAVYRYLKSMECTCVWIADETCERCRAINKINAVH